jgi:uncharacterized protein (TIGR02147 family)
MNEFSIFNFTDYRPFLRSYLRSSSASGRGQISRLAEHVGLNLSVLSLILKGERDLSPEHAYEISEYFAWSLPVKEHFNLLNQYQRASSHKLKKHLLEKIEAHKKHSIDLSNQVKRDVIFTEQQKSVFYSNYMYSAIRMACSFDDGQSLDQLLSRFLIQRNQMTEMVRFLVENNLIVENNGRYFIGPQATHLEKKSLYFKQNHSNWRIMGIQKIDKHEEQDFFYTAPFSISKEDYKKFREDLVQLIKSFVNVAKDSKADMVGCFNIDLFEV